LAQHPDLSQSCNTQVTFSNLVKACRTSQVHRSYRGFRRLMPTIENFPLEILGYIFQLGCERHPRDCYEWRQTPESKRLKHPFAASVTLVCRTWYYLVTSTPNAHYHFMYSYLPHPEEDSFPRQLTDYHHGLQESKGSNLFIECDWRLPLIS
jgi:hypothetical protein